MNNEILRDMSEKDGLWIKKIKKKIKDTLKKRKKGEE